MYWAWWALLGCGVGVVSATEPAPPDEAPIPPPRRALEVLLDPWLADGFDFAVGDPDGEGSYTDAAGRRYEGWYVATSFAEHDSLGVHPGEDWNGRGGGDTDLGQPVRAVARGVVVSSADLGPPWGHVIEVEHLFAENGQPRRIRSQYAHLQERAASVGDRVARRQVIGSIGTGGGAYAAHLHLELRDTDVIEVDPGFWPSSAGWSEADIRGAWLPPTQFIRAHRALPVPAEMERILVVVKSEYRASLVERGQVVHTWRVGLGQAPIGPKLKQGDNRTPEGAYRVLDKSRGPFSGAWAAYFGVAWMRISYPNTVDADRGLAAGRITTAERDLIAAADLAGREPPKTTALGGGIGIHGWAGRWPGEDRQDITWGCLSVQNEELEALYERVPSGTPVWIVR